MTKCLYQTKPYKVESFQWDGSNTVDIEEWSGGKVRLARTGFSISDTVNDYLAIEGPDGITRADIGDYIVRSLTGEYYGCKGDVFREKYEPAEM